MTPLKQQISLIPVSIEHWYSPYKRRRFENRWDQTFCILLIIKDVLSVIESANLCRRQNLKKVMWIRIRIFGLIWIWMSVEYPFQNCGYTVGVIHFAKLGSNRLLIHLIVWELRKQRNDNKCRKIAYSSCSGEENEKPESTRRSASPPKVNHF